MTHAFDRDLNAQIQRLIVPMGQLALWSLGQAGFAIKGGETIAYIDPYLSDAIAESGGPARRFALPMNPATIQHANVVFATHEHADHADGATLGPLLAASPQATLVTSPQGREIALQAGVASTRIVVPRLGERITQGALTYTAIPAAHYAYEVDRAGHSRWMGFLIECNGVTLYHAGDTILIPEILAALAGQRIDLALLPINGRDFFRERREIVGNLWPREAVELAVAINAGVLIGIHNDLFESNRVNPGLLFDEIDRRAPWQRCHLLQPGELYLYAG
ncbi:MAG TPA: MBL fold metallo-hydrolase [Ktedonobacteraceae bacterium]|nr:MBL fold metallo-hydrolase [Ktedonobacteraceae bacterium]